MILVDTSIWIDHLRAEESQLVSFLAHDEVGCHSFVIEELAIGSLAERARVLDLLENLRRFPVLTHDEMMTLVDRHRLWGRGLGAVDVHLLGAVALVRGGRLWTRDKRLRAASQDVGVICIEES